MPAPCPTAADSQEFLLSPDSDAQHHAAVSVAADGQLNPPLVLAGAHSADGDAAPSLSTDDLDLDDLRDVIELCEFGGKVVWPSGLDLCTARSRVLNPYGVVRLATCDANASAADGQPKPPSPPLVPTCERSYDLEALRELAELEELGEKVKWPDGMDLRAARSVLACPPQSRGSATSCVHLSGSVQETGGTVSVGSPDCKRRRTRLEHAASPLASLPPGDAPT